MVRPNYSKGYEVFDWRTGQTIMVVRHEYVAKRITKRNRSLDYDEVQSPMHVSGGLS